MSELHHTLQVDLGDRTYPIYIGPDLIDDAAIYQRHIAGRQVMVVTNEVVAPLYLERVMAALAGFECQSVVLQDGEKYKDLGEWQKIIDALLGQRFNRQCTVLALGGGVVGDMAGFAAACYQRGVKFIQVPTTLLAQVDSSVGGKTGVNHPLGKNMIGAFYQPQCVIADTQTLNTLDDRQLAAGIAEVIKYGLIDDIDFFAWLENNMEALVGRSQEALAFAIRRSCEDKARVVAADELESGSRALLNLGHTFGHAIETGMGYGEWLHGEAVAAGICMAADLSRREGWLSAEEVGQIEALMRRAGLPVSPPQALSAEQFIEHMKVDKKVLTGAIRLVLPDRLGRSVITESFEAANLQDTLNEYGRPTA